jgi:hypothetical protein
MSWSRSNAAASSGPQYHADEDGGSLLTIAVSFRIKREAHHHGSTRSSRTVAEAIRRNRPAMLLSCER